jgi:hypothetical protein
MNDQSLMKQHIIQRYVYHFTGFFLNKGVDFMFLFNGQNNLSDQLIQILVQPVLRLNHLMNQQQNQQSIRLC